MNQHMINFRGLVRTLYALQDQHIRIDNRTKKKKDGTDQKIPEAQLEGYIALSKPVEDQMVRVSEGLKTHEDALAKLIARELKHFPVYTQYLKHVVGVGPLMAGILISEYNIERANTVSKLQQFAGLNPGMVRGKKIVDIEKDTDMSRIIKVIPCGPGAIPKGIMITDEYIRGDKLTSGFVSPFNTRLRTKLLGVLAGSFLRSSSPYAQVYYSFHMPSAKIAAGAVPGRYDVRPDWKDKTDKHRHQGANRQMVKAFLRDLYNNWRALEGLEVRAPYSEEYLGHVHVEETPKTFVKQRKARVKLATV